MKAKIVKNPDSFDWDKIVFDSNKGDAFIGKKDKKIGLVKCPVCNTENYSPSVLSGICCFCEFDVNKIEIL